MPEGNAGVVDPPVIDTLIPQDLKDRPYLKPWLGKPFTPELAGEIFKKLDGAETLVGKKTLIPAADADEKTWDEFLGKLRPAKPEDYEIPVEQGAKPDELFMKSLRESFLSGDISARQAKKFLNAFLPKLKEYGATQNKAALEAKAKADAEFETLVKAAHGDKNKVVMERTKKLIAEHTPAVLKPYVEKLDNNALAIMQAVLNGMAEKYMSEDELKPQSNDTGNSSDDLHKQILTLRSSEAYTNWQHPDHEKTVAKVNAMYAELGKQRKS